LKRALLFAIAIPVLYFALVFNMRSVLGQTNPNCTEFGVQIAVSCCCSNDCCREAPSTEFENLGGDLYRSTVTGQTIKRTGWSAGGYIKCACDLNGQGQWVKHPLANVRCLFVPMPSS
jgi:hypothetical protein